MSRTFTKIKKPTWVANQVMKILIDHQGFNFRIYFNNKCWDIGFNDYRSEQREKEVIENIKASDYGEHMNDDVISVDFSNDTILWEQMGHGSYEMDMTEFGGGKYQNRGWKLVNALDTFMEENGLARENGTSTDFIIINKEDK